MGSINYYKILGVSRDATKEEIVAAKNKLAKQYHPDSTQQFGIDTTEKMQEILVAYRVLSNEEKRKAYDEKHFGKKKPKKEMYNYDFSSMSEEKTDGTFIEYWQASDRLAKILEQSISLFKGKKNREKLRELCKESMHDILILKSGCIPIEYWHPSVMNWILIKWYQNRNLSVKGLLSIYDEHLKNDFTAVDRMKIKRTNAKYEKQIKQLLKYV